MKYILKSDDLETLFKAPSDSNGDVYRIDPFQTIVNVSWDAGGAIRVSGALTDEPPARNRLSPWVKTPRAVRPSVI